MKFFSFPYLFFRNVKWRKQEMTFSCGKSGWILQAHLKPSAEVEIEMRSLNPTPQIIVSHFKRSLKWLYQYITSNRNPPTKQPHCMVPNMYGGVLIFGQ